MLLFEAILHSTEDPGQLILSELISRVPEVTQ